MKFTKTYIDSFSYHLPETILSSEQIELNLSDVYKRLKLPFGRLELMTGIKNRRVWPSGTRPSTQAISAGNKLIEKSNVNKDDFDLLIYSSVCRDFLEPATASVVHHGLGLSSKCQMFDLSNACLSMINALTIAANLIESGSIKRALVISSENASPLIDTTTKTLKEDSTLTRKSIKNYFANFTLGSAAVAFSLCHEDLNSTGIKLLGGATRTHSQFNDLCQGTGNIHELSMQTQSEKLLVAGIDLAKETWSATKENLSMKDSDFNWALGHQVGVAHEKIIMEALNLHEHKTFNTYPEFGNTGSAALPLTLAKALEENLIKKNETIALLGIGSGLTSSMLGAKFC